MDQERLNSLKELQKKLNIHFKDVDYLHNGLLHSSYVNENSHEKENNEKLELLGDSVLAYVVNLHLYLTFPEHSEGELSRIKSIVVSEHSLAGIAKDMDLGSFLLLGRGEQLANGMNRNAILADTLEAVLGAYCLDSGMDKARDFILPYMIKEIDKVQSNRHKKDYKTSLQLITQQERKICPNYITVSESGPDHNKTFIINVSIDNKIIGTGSGSSKKKAQQEAAHDALVKLGHEDPPEA